MAKVKRAEQDNNQDHDELGKRFEVFKQQAHATGKLYKISNVTTQGNRLHASIAYPSHYNPNQNDEFWKLVSNQLIDANLRLTNKQDGKQLVIQVALIENMWLAFASTHLIDTEGYGVEVIKEGNDTLIFATFLGGTWERSFGTYDELKTRLRDYELELLELSPSESNVQQIKLRVQKW